MNTQTAPRPRCAPIAGSKRREHALKRFDELVVKHALRTATPAEEAKLDRYQKLRRQWVGTFYTTPDEARREYRDRLLFKQLRAYLWRASSNHMIGDSHENLRGQ